MFSHPQKQEKNLEKPHHEVNRISNHNAFNSNNQGVIVIPVQKLEFLDIPIDYSAFAVFNVHDNYKGPEWKMSI